MGSGLARDEASAGEHPMETILSTIQSEFADITDEQEITRILVRLLMAALLGAVLGFERESKGKAAGVRTHMLVSLGAALVLAPSMAGADEQALSRVIQGIVAGIGFLGAGTILKGHGQDTSHVKGLTTAAGLWMTAAIGTAAGMGREATALLSTVLALLVLGTMPLLVDKVEGGARRKARRRAGALRGAEAPP
jgi:putative Mg2+ transporter-C (MgtC) family protein